MLVRAVPSRWRLLNSSQSDRRRPNEGSEMWMFSIPLPESSGSATLDRAPRLGSDLPHAPLDMPQAADLDGSLGYLGLVGAVLVMLMGSSMTWSLAQDHARDTDLATRNEMITGRQACEANMLLLGDASDEISASCRITLMTRGSFDRERLWQS